MKRLVLVLGLCLVLVNITLSTAGVYNPTNYWKFDEANNTIGVNDTINNLNLTTNTTNTFRQTGKLGNSLRVKNSGTIGFTNATSGLSNVTFGTGAFTIMIWVNMSDGGNGFNIFSRGGTATTNWGIATVSGQGNLTFNSNSLSVLTTGLNVTNGTYNRIVFVREGTGTNQFRVYVNARNTGNVTFANDLSDTTRTLSGDGANSGSTGYNLDDIKVYKGYALTPAEISADWNNANGFQTPLLFTTLNSPSTSSLHQNTSLIFNATGNTLDGAVNLSNATLFLYNSAGLFNRTTVSLRGKLNSTTFNVSGLTVGSYSWNVLMCANRTGTTACDTAPTNFTFTIGNFVEEFTYIVTEGQSTGINLNITFDGLDPDVLALLIWNNTQSTPSKQIINSSRIRFTSNFVVPLGSGNLSGINISHYWRFYLPDNTLNDTTANQTQNVYSLGIDNCSLFTQLLLNYTMFDEDTISRINGTTSNASIEVQVEIQSLANPSQQTNLSRTYSNSSQALVCISQITSGFRIDAQARYTANNYVVEFTNIQNATLSVSNFPQHINIFPLLTTRSQEFLVTFKDTNFAPVQNALISISRKYVGEGLFRTVEAPETNVDGQALVHLVLGDIIYTIQVSKNGVILGTFENIVAFCTNIATGECTINLNQLSGGTQSSNFNTVNGLTYRFAFNKTARTITSIFTTVDGSNAFVNLTGALFDNRGNNTVCSSSVTTSSGSLFCTIPISVGNSTIKATLYKDGLFVGTALFSLTDASDTGFGSTGIIMMLILYITLPLMMISSGIGIVIGAIMGLIFGGLLNLYTSGSIIGTGSTIIWFIVAGAIIIWKIIHKEGR